MSCESKCSKWFRSGDSACKGCSIVARNDDSDDVCAAGFNINSVSGAECEKCDEEGCPDRNAEYLDDDDTEDTECAMGFVVDNVEPSECETCSLDNCPFRKAEYDEDVGNDGRHEDDFGNRGTKLFKVKVDVSIHRHATIEVTVAADDAEEAESRGQCAVESMDDDEMDFSDECDNDVVSCEEKDDHPF